MTDSVVSLTYKDTAVRDRLARLHKLSADFGRIRVVVGTNRRYMADHQLGNPRRRIPQRQFLGVTDSDRAEILRIFDEAIADPERDAYTTFSQIGEWMLLSTDLRWEQRVDPRGVPWKPLSPYTLALKRSEGKLLQILERTGIARSTIAYQVIRS